MTSSPKTTLRQSALLRRASIPPHIHASASQAACLHLVRYIASRHAPGTVIAGYVPLGSELDVMTALHMLMAQGYPVALPVTGTADRRLTFRRWHSDEPLQKAQYEIEVPMESAEIVTPRVVIVPMAAFDHELHRLGYGKAYYDTTLAHLRATDPALDAMGAAFAVQEAPKLPIGPHDERLDAVVTEQGVLQRKSL